MKESPEIEENKGDNIDPTNIGESNNSLFSSERVVSCNIKSNSKIDSKEEINKLKDNFKIEKKQNYDFFQEECINHLYDFYKIIDTNYQNFSKNKVLISSYFGNKLIDENRVDDIIIHKKNLDDSILKKNIVILIVIMNISIPNI